MQAIEFLVKEIGDSVAKTARDHGLVRQSLMGQLRRKTDYTLKAFGELANSLGLIDPKLYREIAAMPWPERSGRKRKTRNRSGAKAKSETECHRRCGEMQCPDPHPPNQGGINNPSRRKTMF